MNIESNNQIIGCAYTYQTSYAMRKHLTKDIQAYHSSQERDFSYFLKGFTGDAVRSGEPLVLRRDPRTETETPHWPEPELALVLGEKHEIVGYTLANDLTAFLIETGGRTTEFDGTYYGKLWKGSVALGPKVVSAQDLSVDALTIGLRIKRGDTELCNLTYSTKWRKRNFNELPLRIVQLYKDFGGNLPPSKRTKVEGDYLPEGTVVLCGTGIVVSKQYYLKAGDIVTVYAEPFEELANPVVQG